MVKLGEPVRAGLGTKNKSLRLSLLSFEIVIFFSSLHCPLKVLQQESFNTNLCILHVTVFIWYLMHDHLHVIRSSPVLLVNVANGPTSVETVSHQAGS